MNKKTINVKSGADFIKKIRVNDGFCIAGKEEKLSAAVILKNKDA
ncbi:hypothetical protein [Dickeya dianthicola]|nr:hypothetical protein [Dickeya dianthicola]